ncbi:MAG: UDP-N-acetylmuramate dehydrogenase [Chloroflexi bacterium]|nr:UDP-N-acetylmuramate dehydrogenase [Chloroflexota bacterium]
MIGFLEELGNVTTCRRDESMVKHTTLRVGGEAEYYVKARHIGHVFKTAYLAHQYGLPLFVLGMGSNILVDDKGIRGLVLENHASTIRVLQNHRLLVDSGAPLSRTLSVAAKAGLTGLEWAAGLPGTVGGAIVNNAGAHGHSIQDSLKMITMIDRHGTIRVIPAYELGLGYRTSRFREDGQGEIIIWAELALAPGNKDEITKRIHEYLLLRRGREPNNPSVGSIFKNPTQSPAGKLIEECGLKGCRIGNAQVSPKHGNFIVNLGKAKAADVSALISLVRQRVQEKTGVVLDLEIQLVGQWNAPPGEVA